MSCISGTHTGNRKAFFDLSREAEVLECSRKSVLPVQERFQSCERWSLEVLFCDPVFYTASGETPSVYLKEKEDLLSWAISLLSLSPTAEKILEDCMDQGWFLALENLEGPDFHLDVPEKTIVLDHNGLSVSALAQSEYFRHMVLVSCIRALRDVWHEKRHGAFEDLYALEDVLVLERVRASDLDIMTVLIAWELREEGFCGLWRSLISGEDGDLAMCFYATLEGSDGSPVAVKKALSAIFQEWFEDESRIRLCDHESLNYFDAFVCGSLDRSPAGKKVSAIGIETLSCLPDKTAYLRGMGPEILRHPKYAGLNDPINQSHFLQILHDISAVWVHDVPFRDLALARKIFPNGAFTPQEDLL